MFYRIARDPPTHARQHACQIGGRSMKISVIGATGRTGRELVGQALARGHDVVAVARSPERLTVSAKRLTPVAADAHDRAALGRAIDGSTAIVSALGAAQGRAPTDVYSAGTANLLRAMAGAGTRRLAVISAAPAGPWEEQPALFRMLVGPLLERFFAGVYADMRRMEHELVRCREVEWSCLRPPRLVARPATGYRLDRRPLPRTRTLTHADLAAALLDCVDGAQPRTGMLYVAG
jgi:putative NADH-flavin reductase